jgi:peptidoglycan/xylan/chitin deacetylase (PgdA/CDA1 family)
VLTTVEFLEHLENGKTFEQPSCLITFDDGWKDTYEEAWPALRRHRLSAVVFLPVDMVGTDQAFWQEHLGYQLYAAWERFRHDKDRIVEHAAILPPRLRHVLEAAPAQVRAVIQHAVESLKNDPAGVDHWAIVRSLEAAGTAGVPMVDRLMSWNDVRSMAAAGITFGGHGATHRILTNIPAADVSGEVESSKRRIESELETSPLVFSYPNGGWNADVAEMVRRAGYRAAFSTAPGPAAVTADRFSVRRVNVHENAASSPSLLLATIAGIL